MSLSPLNENRTNAPSLSIIGHTRVLAHWSIFEGGRATTKSKSFAPVRTYRRLGEYALHTVYTSVALHGPFATQKVQKGIPQAHKTSAVCS